MADKKKKAPAFTLVLITILVAVAIFSGLKVLSSLEKTVDNSPASSSKTVEFNGEEYFPRQDITVLMLMGIDEYGEVKESGSYNNTGENDMVALLKEFCIYLLLEICMTIVSLLTKQVKLKTINLF